MYAAFDASLRASNYNMFCAPLKPVQAPTAFKKGVLQSGSPSVVDFDEEVDQEEVIRRTKAEYEEFNRLFSSSGM
jgi:hypothetical protein